MNKLPHEITEMLDHAEAVADFLLWCVHDTADRQLTLIDGGGNPWPVDNEEFAKWEQSIRNLKQMVLHAH